MTASLAWLTGLAFSAEAFPFDWSSRSDFRRQDVTSREGSSGRIVVAAREKSADKQKPVAKESELAAKAKGVLTISLPKTAEAQKQAQKIEIKPSA